MTIRYVCVRCEGEKCPRCTGRGWVGEGLVRIERQNKLAEAVATNLVQKKVADEEAWAARAAEKNLTTDQFTEVEIWSATGPIKYQLMSLTEEVLDALANLVGVEMPPVFVSDQPKLKVVG
jgi:uncharacterized membrane protein YheB (UPF0754 family)